MDIAIIIAVVTVALVFDYTNGFHDAANAIATSVSTRALTPRIALAMAAVMNFIGAFLGQEVASTVSDVISPPDGTTGLVVVMAGLDEYWIEINRLENAGDKSYRRILAQLFSGKYKALEVMKLKDVVDSLEAAIDAFETVANTVEQIALKES